MHVTGYLESLNVENRNSKGTYDEGQQQRKDPGLEIMNGHCVSNKCHKYQKKADMDSVLWAFLIAGYIEMEHMFRNMKGP